MQTCSVASTHGHVLGLAPRLGRSNPSASHHMFARSAACVSLKNQRLPDASASASVSVYQYQRRSSITVWLNVPGIRASRPGGRGEPPRSAVVPDRRLAADGMPYTAVEFDQSYGPWGQAMWQAASGPSANASQPAMGSTDPPPTLLSFAGASPISLLSFCPSKFDVCRKRRLWSPRPSLHATPLKWHTSCVIVCGCRTTRSQT